MAVRRIVAYAGGDELAASREFYVEVLGMRVAMENPVLDLQSPDGAAAEVIIGAQVAQQYLAAGLLDELELHVVPVVLGDGARLFDNLGDAEVQLEQATQAARGKDVMLYGGAQVAQQYLAAGLLDELELHVVPVVLGDGARLFDNLGDAEVQLEQVRAVEAPGVTHLKYRILPGAPS